MDKQLIQQVIERSLYCEGYNDALKKFNEQFEPKKFKTNFDIGTFKQTAKTLQTLSKIA